MAPMMFYKIRKVIFRPFWKIRDYFLSFFSRQESNYNDPQKYWKKRHKKFSFDLRGVGNCSLSSEENEKTYDQARKTFKQLCQQENLNLPEMKILDIGCGTGFYAEIFQSCSVTDYLGVDITNQLFRNLKAKFPNYRFKKLDITKDPIDEKFDLITMIDVTQHIVTDELFSSAMENINSCLKNDGVFIVTSWLSDQFIKRRPYEVERPMSFYKKAFPDAFFMNPIPFRDKNIFLIRKQHNSQT